MADHVAYPETRQWSTLLGVAVAGGGLAVAFVASGSLLAPLAGHVVIHTCVILAGGEVPPYERILAQDRRVMVD